MVEEPRGVLLSIVNEYISEHVSNSGEKPTVEGVASPCLLSLLWREASWY